MSQSDNRLRCRCRGQFIGLGRRGFSCSLHRRRNNPSHGKSRINLFFIFLLWFLRILKMGLGNQQVFGRHVAHDTMISGAYKSEYADKEQFEVVAKKVDWTKFEYACQFQMIIQPARAIPVIDWWVGGLRRSSSTHPGRQDGTRRTRSWRKSYRYWIRWPWLRCWHRPSIPGVSLSLFRVPSQ